MRWWRAAAVLIVVVVLPALLNWLLGLRSVGLVALMLSLFGAILWMQSGVSLRLTMLILVLLAAGACALWAEPASGAVVAFVSGRFEPRAAALLMAGAAATVLGLMRLARTNEDMPNYHFLKLWMQQGRGQKHQMTGWQWVGAETTERGRRHRLEERSIARLTEHARRASASRWSRVCRWQVGPFRGRSNWVIGLGAVLFLLLLAWAIGKEMGTVLLPIASIVFPAITMVQYAMWRLGRELLMPVDRAAFLRQLGTAAALDQLQFWGAMSVGTILWWLLAAPKQLPPVAMMNLLASSALCQIGLFGVGIWAVWLARRCSPQVGIVVFACANALFWFTMSMIMMNQSQSDLWVSTSPVAAAGLFASFGLLITWAGYHRWLVTDLD